MSTYPCCEHCAHDEPVEHTGPCMHRGCPAQAQWSARVSREAAGTSRIYYAESRKG